MSGSFVNHGGLGTDFLNQTKVEPIVWTEAQLKAALLERGVVSANIVPNVKNWLELIAPYIQEGRCTMELFVKHFYPGGTWREALDAACDERT